MARERDAIADNAMDRRQDPKTHRPLPVKAGVDVFS